MNTYYTNADVQLTEEEAKLIRSLQRLSVKWKRNGKRLWLYSASGTLCVMLDQGGNNPHPRMGGLNPSNEGVNQDNVVTTIDIPNDGGDW